VLAGLGNYAHPLNPIRDGHPLCRRYSLFSWRINQSIVAVANELHPVKIRFACPICETPGRLDIPGKPTWQCSACDHTVLADDRVTDVSLPVCAVCGNHELFKKKNFPHQLGLTILTIACVLSFITYLNYEKVLTWLILGGTAVFDVLLYLWVGDAVVCYRCGATHTKITPGPEHQPFDLGTSERYRQEQIRRQQLAAERGKK
jgi:hypothetical protein